MNWGFLDIAKQRFSQQKRNLASIHSKKENKMRKASVLLLFFSIILSASLALPNTIGIKGGANFSGFLFEDERLADGSLEIMQIPVRHRIGLTIGAFYSIEIADGFSLQPEIFYSVKGGGATTFVGISTVSWIEKMSFLELPILLKFRLSDLSLMVGPYVALLLQDELKGAQHGIGLYERTKQEMNRKDIDSGIVFGAGLNSGKASFEIRYTLGLINLLEDGYLKTSSLAFLLGVSF